MKLNFLVLLLSVLGVLQSSHAQNSKYMIDGVDTTPLVEALNRQVTTLKKPIKVYHWFNADPNSKWAEQYSANDPRGFEFVKFASQKYWNEFGNNSQDNYGTGLHAALDPVWTQRYGGTNWVLVEISLPVGTRIFDLGDYSSPPLRTEPSSVLNKLGCNGSIASIDNLFSRRGLQTFPQRCIDNLKSVLKNHVQFDSILYGYSSSYFHNCERESRQKALIITESSKLKSNLLKMYNSKTPDELRGRTIIQSLFYKAASDATLSEEDFMSSGIMWIYVSDVVANSYPGFKLKSLGVKAEICPLDSTYSSVGCKEIPVPTPTPEQYAKYISSNDIPFTTTENIGGLLWKDLDGKPTDPKIDEWIANNLYGCGK